MSIVDAPFIDVAVPQAFSPISKAYWQTNASVEEIALRFSLKSGKAVLKRAGPAVLRGIICKHCSQHIVAKNRAHAIGEINGARNSGKVNRVECSPCFRKERDRRFMNRNTERQVDTKAQAKRSNRAAKKTVQVSVSTKEDFYKSWDWRTLRMEVLKEHGRACQCCGAEPGMKTAAGEPVRICVDHIKPLSKFWHLRLDRKNLQVLCDECNQGKGNWDQTDFRPQQGPDEWIIEGDGIDPAIMDQLSVHGETLQ